MAIVRIQDTPSPDGSTALYDRVNEAMDVEGDPPEGATTVRTYETHNVVAP